MCRIFISLAEIFAGSFSRRYAIPSDSGKEYRLSVKFTLLSPQGDFVENGKEWLYFSSESVEEFRKTESVAFTLGCIRVSDDVGGMARELINTTHFFRNLRHI